MFLLSGLEASSSFPYVIRRTVFAWDSIDIKLEIQRFRDLAGVLGLRGLPKTKT